MTDSEWRRTGTGPTPYGAVSDLAPDSDEADHVAWVEGVHAFSERADPAECEESVRRDLTVIYESRPLETWRVEVVPEDETWRAVRVGTQQVDR